MPRRSWIQSEQAGYRAHPFVPEDIANGDARNRPLAPDMSCVAGSSPPLNTCCCRSRVFGQCRDITSETRDMFHWFRGIDRIADGGICRTALLP